LEDHRDLVSAEPMHTIRRILNQILTIKDDTTTLSGPISASNDHTVPLTAADYAAWDLSLLNVEIDGSSDAVIKQIELDVRFSDFLAFQES